MNMLATGKVVRVALAVTLVLFAVVALAEPAFGQAVRTNAGFRSVALGRDDDRPTGYNVARDIGFQVNFFLVVTGRLYVSNNGNITFDGPSSKYTPEALAGTSNQIIAPFFADVDTRGARSQVVTFGQDTVNGRPAFGVNWVDVGYFSGHDDKLNSFQLVLIERSDTGSGNFDIEFNYDKIQWEAGGANGGSGGLCASGCVAPSVGWSNGKQGSQKVYYQVVGSLEPGAFLDRNPNGLRYRTWNSNVPGRLVFQARQGVVVSVALNSLDPPSIAAGSGSFTLTVNGTNFQNGAWVLWNGTALATTFVTTAQLRATVPSNLVAAAGTAQVTVQNPTGPASNPITFTVSVSAPTLSGIDPSSAQMGSPAVRVRATGTNFVNAAVVRWNGPVGGQRNLSSTFLSSTQLDATVDASLLTSPGTAQVAVVNPNGSATGSLPFTVLPIQAPAITLTATSPATPTDSATIAVRLAGSASADYTATLSLDFSPNNVAGIPSGYRDPALRFANGSTTFTFSIPTGASSVSVPAGGAIQPGTVAGTVTVRLSDLRVMPANYPALVPSMVANATITVPRMAPVITPGSARIVDVTGSGFTVELSGYSTVRDLSAATFNFSPASGARLDGTTSFSVPLSSLAVSWFASDTGRNNGSRFSVRVPFTMTGDTSAIGSVTVSLQNSVGTSSAASGGR